LKGDRYRSEYVAVVVDQRDHIAHASSRVPAGGGFGLAEECAETRRESLREC
jgi:hypothetical protein